MLDISIRSGDIHDRSMKLSEVDPNFARFLVPKLLERAPKFWDVDYKTELTSEHVAKFRGDRPTDLGYLAVKRKK